MGTFENHVFMKDISALLHLDNLEVNHKIDVSIDQSLFVTVR